MLVGRQGGLIQAALQQDRRTGGGLQILLTISTKGREFIDTTGSGLGSQQAGIVNPSSATAAHDRMSSGVFAWRRGCMVRQHTSTLSRPPGGNLIFFIIAGVSKKKVSNIND